MVTAETKRVCDQAEQEIKQLIPKAQSAFLERVKACVFAEDLYRKVPMIAQATGVSVSTLLASGKVEILKDNLSYRRQVENVIKPIADKLQTALNSIANAEDILFMVERLESLAKIAEGFRYTNTKYDISLTSCHECVLAEAEKWREKITKDPTIRKATLKIQLRKNQTELEKTQKELESNRSDLEARKKDIAEVFETYQDRVAEVLLNVKKDYQRKLEAMEAALTELVEESKIRCIAHESFARASLFNRKRRERDYHITEEAYQKTYFNVKRHETELSNFVATVFIPEFEKIDKRIDELLLKTEELNAHIGANEAAIRGYTGAISKIKEELKLV